MIKRLITLYNLIKNTKEASSILRLIKLAGYDDEWREIINERAKLSPKPFDHWFDGQQRLYFPYEQEPENVDPDEEIAKYLLDWGYGIIDWMDGIAQKDGRKIRIGKLFNNIQKTLEKIEDNQEERQLNKSLLNKFINHPTRANKENQNKMQIVISQDPHDVAKMSTDRGWKSCMELGKGSQHRNVFCEVEDGALIAYLINEDDKEIQKPVARISIKRYSSDDNVNIAIPEQAIYGKSNEHNFYEFVKKWLEEKNKIELEKSKNEIIEFSRDGGQYTDSLLSREIRLNKSIPTDRLFDILEKRKKYYIKVFKIKDNFRYFVGGSKYDIMEDKKFKTKEDAIKYIDNKNTKEAAEYIYKIVQSSKNAGHTIDTRHDKSVDEILKERFEIKEGENLITFEDYSHFIFKEILQRDDIKNENSEAVFESFFTFYIEDIDNIKDNIINMAIENKEIFFKVFLKYIKSDYASGFTNKSTLIINKFIEQNIDLNPIVRSTSGFILNKIDSHSIPSKTILYLLNISDGYLFSMLRPDVVSKIINVIEVKNNMLDCTELIFNMANSNKISEENKEILFDMVKSKIMGFVQSSKRILSAYLKNIYYEVAYLKIELKSTYLELINFIIDIYEKEFEGDTYETDSLNDFIVLREQIMRYRNE